MIDRGEIVDAGTLLALLRLRDLGSDPTISTIS
jgi:hypothetical protein